MTGDKVRWPQKATRMVLDLVKNAEANAEIKGLDVDNLYVCHAQANRSIKQRRRTYRAHGRINAYMSNPAHIELMVAEKEEPVAKGDEQTAERSTRKAAAKLRFQKGRVAAGGGI